MCIYIMQQYKNFLSHIAIDEIRYKYLLNISGIKALIAIFKYIL